MTRTYKINTTAILSPRQTSAAYASTILAQNADTVSVEKGYIKRGNIANAILQGLCDSVDKIAPRLSEGDRLEILIGKQISHLFPRIVAHQNAPVSADLTASEELIQRFRGKVISLHLQGVDTSFSEAPDNDPAVWRTLQSHCEMTLAMAA